MHSTCVKCYPKYNCSLKSLSQQIVCEISPNTETLLKYLFIICNKQEQTWRFFVVDTDHTVIPIFCKWSVGILYSFRSSRLQKFFKIAARNIAQYSQENTFLGVSAFRPATLLKRYSNVGAYCEILKTDFLKNASAFATTKESLLSSTCFRVLCVTFLYWHWISSI